MVGSQLSLCPLCCEGWLGSGRGMGRNLNMHLNVTFQENIIAQFFHLFQPMGRPDLIIKQKKKLKAISELEKHASRNNIKGTKETISSID